MVKKIKLKGIPASETQLKQKIVSFEAAEGEYDILFQEPLLGDATDDYQALSDKEKLIEIVWATAFDPDTKERLFDKESLMNYPPHTLRKYADYGRWLYLGMSDPEDTAKKK